MKIPMPNEETQYFILVMAASVFIFSAGWIILTALDIGEYP